MPSPTPAHVPPSFGPLLRKWRHARGLSQERLAHDAEISTRHLSFLENRNAAPSREMVLLLASALELPLRERNAILIAAGFAPVYRESPFEGPSMTPIRRALDHLLRAHEPYGAVAFDRLWDIRASNRGATRMIGALLDKPLPPHVASNALRLFFHPDGLRSAIVEWEEVAAEFVERIHREVALAQEGDALRAILDEVLAYDGVPPRLRAAGLGPLEPFLVVHMRKGGRDYRFFTTITSLGTPLDVTAQELRIESYFPADDATDAWMRGLAGD
jgi:transcriptional regulator with XRE-family HTH domain